MALCAQARRALMEERRVVVEQSLETGRLYLCEEGEGSAPGTRLRLIQALCLLCLHTPHSQCNIFAKTIVFHLFSSGTKHIHVFVTQKYQLV